MVTSSASESSAASAPEEVAAVRELGHATTVTNPSARAVANGLTGRRWWLATTVVLFLALAATVPTAGDLGLTWDEPAYRFSQLVSAQWWQRLAHARTSEELADLFAPDTLLYYWPYGRYGKNFHPPLAGQLSLATHALFGRWMKDIPSRRLASVFEYALTITLAFGFLARRYGCWVGAIAAGSLLFMPRVYADGHIAGTDTPGLLLWAAAAAAFWKGLYEPNARRWRVLAGVLVGLAFVEKLAAVIVVGPLVAWLILVHLPRTLGRRGGRSDWVDGVFTTMAMLLPLAIAFAEIRRIAPQFPPPKNIDLFDRRFQSPVPGAILAVPLVVWLVRRLLGRLLPRHPVWGAERPALETWTAFLAFGPLIAWLGNPAWWRVTLPRLAHYYVISSGRRDVLPTIQVLYLGQAYEFSLPWHNAWVLIAVTVPAGILIASVIGLIYMVRNLGRDRLPLFFLVHLVTLPAMRMFDTPAHDGVRLFLPTFFFLAAFAGWGAVWFADGLAWFTRARAGRVHAVVAALVLVPAAWQLVRIHPFELSYYNELVGGPRGAWKSGFELTYWYDAFNTRTLDDINKILPRDAVVAFFNDKTNPDTFLELQSLGALRADLVQRDLGNIEFPYVWLLTQDSKASAFTRLLFAMKPWYARTPPQLDGLRVVTLADPAAVSRAWDLQLLLDTGYKGPPRHVSAPPWVERYAPRLARLWGVGLTPVSPLAINEELLTWARTDPAGLRAAAKAVAAKQVDADANARRLWAILSQNKNLQLETDYPRVAEDWKQRMFWSRPQALIEAVEIVITRPDALRTILLRYPYTDPTDVGGFLDQDIPPTHPPR